MGKQLWKPGNMLYPLPAVLVSCGSSNGEINVLTVAWTGTICSDPPMLYISVRKSRYSYHILKETGEFYVNLTTEKLARATDLCGVKSGRDIDKWEKAGITPAMGILKTAPYVEESPVSIACHVREIRELGSHDMFISDVVGVYADEAYMDASGRFDLSRAQPIVYSHGQYYGLGQQIGSFGFSVRRKKKKKK